MTVLTESNHEGEFVVSLANGKRSFTEGAPEAAFDAPAAKVVSGTVVQLTAGEWKAVVDLDTDPVGVLYTTIPQGETLVQVAVIDKDAEVALGRLTFPSGFDAGKITAATVRLEAQGIKVV